MATDPRRATYAYLADYLGAIAVSGRYAYAADYVSGLAVIDLLPE